MNFGELKTAILSDSHREDYTAHVARFVQEAEGLIASRLEAFSLEYTFGDADRSPTLDTTSNIYTLPSKVVMVRHILYNNLPLDEQNESSIGLYRSLQAVCMYTMRPLTIALAGVPPSLAALKMLYFGLPPALSADGDTNTLLTDYPQLYKEAAQVSLFKRAMDLERASAAFQSVISLIDDINRRVKKQMGGAQSTATPYNVTFRSSY